VLSAKLLLSGPATGKKGRGKTAFPDRRLINRSGKIYLRRIAMHILSILFTFVFSFTAASAAVKR